MWGVDFLENYEEIPDNNEYLDITSSNMTIFDIPNGEYPTGDIVVIQTDAFGNVSGELATNTKNIMEL